MTTFTGFSEAAKLYAAHEPIVDAMFEHLKADAATFWEAVEEELGRRVEIATIESTTASGYTHFKLLQGGAPRCSVWVQRTHGRLVREGTVWIGFSLACAASDTALLAAGSALAAKFGDLPPKALRRRKPTPVTLFEVDLPLDEAALVASFCDRVAPVLARLFEIASAPRAP